MIMWDQLTYVALVVAGFVIGTLGYKAKVVNILRATSKLLDELGDDADALANYLNAPTEENKDKVINELKDDLPAIAEFICTLKGNESKGNENKGNKGG